MIKASLLKLVRKQMRCASFPGREEVKRGTTKIFLLYSSSSLLLRFNFATASTSRRQQCSYSHLEKNRKESNLQTMYNRSYIYRIPIFSYVFCIPGDSQVEMIKNDSRSIASVNST